MVPYFVAGLVLGSRMEEGGGRSPSACQDRMCRYHFLSDSAKQNLGTWTHPDETEAENIMGSRWPCAQLKIRISKGERRIWRDT